MSRAKNRMQILDFMVVFIRFVSDANIVEISCKRTDTLLYERKVSGHKDKLLDYLISTISTGCSCTLSSGCD